MSKLPVNLVFGATGAGKTTALRHLLAQRAGASRWALVINDHNEAAAPTAVPPEVTVREVRGCACCTAQVALRTAIVDVVRRHRPERLLLEASGLAAPQALLDLLRAPGLSTVVRIAPVLTVVDAQQLLDPRYFENETYRAQLACGEVILLRPSQTLMGRSDGEVQARVRLLVSPHAVLCTDLATLPVPDRL